MEISDSIHYSAESRSALGLYFSRIRGFYFIPAEEGGVSRLGSKDIGVKGGISRVIYQQ